MAAATAATADDGATTTTSETEKMLAAAGVAKPSLKDAAVSVEKEEGPMTKQTPAGGTPAPKPGLTKQSTLALLNRWGGRGGGGGWRGGWRTCY